MANATTTIHPSDVTQNNTNDTSAETIYFHKVSFFTFTR